MLRVSMACLNSGSPSVVTTPKAVKYVLSPLEPLLLPPLWGLSQSGR